MLNFKEIFEKSCYKIYDIECLNYYLDLVSKSYDGSEYSELHHILPKCMFKEYESSTENIVRLKYSDHVLAHKLLSDIFKIYKLKLAYMFMTSIDIEKKLFFLAGEYNPAKCPKVRAKISKSKLGKSRNDLKGKQYFGASEEKIKLAHIKSGAKHKNTVCVKDAEGHKFRVSVNDPRYLSGELVSHNKGQKLENHPMRSKETALKCISNRNKALEKFKTISYDDMVQFLVDAHNNGKKVLSEARYFRPNYVKFCNITKFDQKSLRDSVVQRLSKG